MQALLYRLRLSSAAGCIGLLATCVAEPRDRADSAVSLPDTPGASPNTDARGTPGSSGPRWGGPLFVERGSDITWSPRTLLDSAIVDIDRDSAAERIELYAAVERDRQGRVMFDDGQHWAVVVRDGADVYTLFDGFIQLGRIDFWVVVPADTSAPAVLLFQRTPNGVLVQKYVFDRQRGGFVSRGAVDATGEVVHRPPPD